MIRIIEDKDTGKTRRLMEECAKVNGVFVCANPYRMVEKAKAYGLTGFDIISYFEYMNDINDYRNSKCFIDELEQFIYEASNGNNLSGYTISLE